MTIDSAFASSSASELIFFAVWIAVGLAALVLGAALVVRANRVFRKRVNDVQHGIISNQLATERAGQSLPTAA